MTAAGTSAFPSTAAAQSDNPFRPLTTEEAAQQGHPPAKGMLPALSAALPFTLSHTGFRANSAACGLSASYLASSITPAMVRIGLPENGTVAAAKATAQETESLEEEEQRREGVQMGFQHRLLLAGEAYDHRRHQALGQHVLLMVTLHQPLIVHLLAAGTSLHG